MMRSDKYRFGFCKEIKEVWIRMLPWNNKYQGRKKMGVGFKIKNKSVKGYQ